MVRNENDTSRGKPDPERDLLMVAALGIAAATVVAIEDSYNGMLAAKAAGLRCVVAPNMLTQGRAFTKADLVVASLAEVDLARLRRVVESINQTEPAQVFQTK